MKNSERLLGARISALGIMASCVGLIASLGSLLLWLMFLFVNPYSTAEIGGVTYILALGMCSLSVLGILACRKGRLSLMYLVFLGSLPAGLYFVLTPGVFKWLGLFCMLYLASTIGMTVDRVMRRLNQKAKQR